MRSIAARAAAGAAVLAGVLAAAGCGGGHDATPDAAVPPDAAPADATHGDPSAPLSLADTGLCSDPGCAQITADAHEYVPRFPLWADTATKRRWVYLPPGTQIDTSDGNHWVFPVGTRFWKEFSRDGVRVETRYITKLAANEEAPGAWFYVSFAWNQTQDATRPVTAGEANVNGTQHDIPSRQDCHDCHDGLRPGRILGFQAIQLDHTDPDGLLDLDRVVQLGWLSQAPPAAVNGAHYPFPADATQPQAAALGYLHANCGHCHNPSSAVHDMTPMELRLDVGKLATLAGTPTYATTTNVATRFPFTDGATMYTTIIVPEDPAHSALAGRVNATDPKRHMPKLGSELTDPQAASLVLGWINAL